MRSVRLILSDEVPGLGDVGDLVRVKVGYARNFLLPKGKAVLATESRIAEVEHNRRVVAERAAKDRKDLEALRDRLQSLDLEISAKAGEAGKLFGSVTSAQVVDLLAQKGFEIDRRKISLPDQIKEIGQHSIPVRLRGDLVAEVRLHVTAEE
jgi:large subunit ribosomal protein L9